MSHVSVYRRWRPQIFEEVIGQQRITQTLQNAIKAGRITHAYLFTGHRGTGKTTLARILAKALNCAAGPTPNPDNTCDNCLAVNVGSSLDVIEIDGASHTQVDHIRDLKEKVVLAPAAGRYKIYIIDEVHMLSTSAFNALLKTLEEPPPHAIFVLVTTEPHRIPPTVASRCQRFDFRRVPVREIETRLRRIAQAEQFAIQDDALRHIARLADGSVRDADSILDQVSAYKDEGITTDDILTVLGAPHDATLFALVDAILRRDAAEALRVVTALLDEGKDARQIMRTVTEHFRDLLIAKSAEDPAAALDTTDERLAALRTQAEPVTVTDLLRPLKILTDAEVETRTHPQPRLLLEISVIRLTRPEMDPTLEGVTARLDALERGSRKDPVTSSPPTPTAPAPKAPERPSPTRRSPPPSPSPARRTQATLQPPPAPADPPPGSNGEVALAVEDIRLRWARVLEEVRRQRALCHALLIEGMPVEVRGNTVVIGLRPGYNFHMDSLHRTDNRAVVEQALESVFGRRLRLLCRVEETVVAVAAGGPANSHDTAPKAPETTLVSGPVQPESQDALVARAMELFGGEVVEVRRLDNAHPASGTGTRGPQEGS